MKLILDKPLLQTKANFRCTDNNKREQRTSLRMKLKNKFIKIATSNETIQLTEKLSQDLCQYANLVPTAEQKISGHFLCWKREPANASQVVNNSSN